jgi:hypothetical protein
MAQSLETQIISDLGRRFMQGAMMEGEKHRDYWMSKSGPVLIETMDFHHLESIVNLFSRDDMVVDPLWQDSFEKVMLTYLRKQAQINDVHKDIL